nr:saccharopine dehydrogenase [Gammaproteobacteria bacterium]
ALYGELLVKLCALSGTDYCDLTGEAQWIKRMVERYENEARASGARIVHSCGFDSIPSDLGVKFLQDLAQEHFGAYCNHVKMRVKATKGGASGGTIASALNLVQEAAKEPSLRQELKDPYSICPLGHSFKARQKTVAVEYDEDFNSWVGPFLMAAINQRIVLRTNALLSRPYDPDFTYDEGTLTGDGRKGEKRAKRLSAVSSIGMVGVSLPPIRWLATRFFLPKPGEGPSLEQQDKGFFDLRFFGSNDQGGKIIVKVTGDKDPGYGATAKMLAQAGISLCRDVDKGSLPGGFWTPASVFGARLFERLQAHAGMTFEALSVLNPQSQHDNVTDMN